MMMKVTFRCDTCGLHKIVRYEEPEDDPRYTHVCDTGRVTVLEPYQIEDEE